MKKLALISLVMLLFIGCKEPKGYVTLSGKIENIESKELTISSKKFSKTIILNDDGTFKDTLKVEKGIYTLSDGKNRTPVFLANGYDLKINTDATDFPNITFDGKGTESNNYILERIKLSKTDLFNPKSYFLLEKPAFDAKVEEFKKASTAISINDVDSLIVAQISGDDTRFLNYIKKNYQAKYDAAVKFARGKPSPKFTNLENYKGGTTSLDDLKGKYVYIDVWATWCGPCKQQIPFLKKIEEEYHGKNIEFVSISTDRKNKYNAWRKMIVDRQMIGIQLYAGNNNTFSQEYQINSIPRFILVDPEGNIVDADAPRPSDPKLKELFNSLNI
ncbi:MAG: TlpA family protein disulfide reductase [Flavobacteriaceae bacterium]|nr:TlpA family protein disulfide reductase [Flavobacteriaceae bacterium]